MHGRPSLGYQLGLAVVAVVMVLLPAVYVGLVLLGRLGRLAPRHEPLLPRAGRPRLVARLAAMVRPAVRGGGADPLHGVAAAGQGRAATARRGSRRGRGAVALHLHRADLPKRSAPPCRVAWRSTARSNAGRAFGGAPGQPVQPGHDADHRLASRGGTGQDAVRRRPRPRVRAFSQVAGMRLTYVVRHVNAWFSRAVAECDWVGLAMASAGRASGVPGRHPVGHVRLHLACLWLSRGTLWMLAQVGHAVSCYMLRQMEYDADRHQCQVAGSVAFRETMLRLQELNLAGQAASATLSESWRAQRLPDSLPQLIVGTFPEIPPDVREEASRMATGAKTGLFDTHPCDADRMRAAETPRRAGPRPLDRPGDRRCSGLRGAQPEGHPPLVREGPGPAHPGREPRGHRDVPSRDALPARHSRPGRALLRRGELGLPPDLDRPAGAAADLGSRRGSRRAPIGPRSHEGGGRPRDLRPEAAGADPRASLQCRDGTRAVGGGLRDRPGHLRVAGRHAGGGEGRDRAPGGREQAERGAPPGVRGPGRGPPAGGAAGARPPLPGAACRRRAAPAGGGGAARPGAGRVVVGAPAASRARWEALAVADAARDRWTPGRPGTGERRRR